MALIDVIKYEGGPDVFAWKYPSDELRLGTQIIVNESQEVIFFKGGQALDRLGPGRHTLHTSNIPLLRKVVNIPFGGKSPFKAEIWYINKIHSLNIKWGTPTPIQLQDPKYGVFVPVRTFGQFGIEVVDPKKFLTRTVGVLPKFGEEDIKNYFKGVYITKVKDNISQYIIKQNISILHINAYLDEISEFVKEKTKAIFDKYGIRLLNFNINDISVPENDPAVAQLKAALAKRAEMDIVGYNYAQERSFDTMQMATDNPSSEQNSVMGAGIGMGVGMGVGGAIGSQFGAMANNFDLGNGATNMAGQQANRQNINQQQLMAMGMNVGQPMQNGQPMQGAMAQTQPGMGEAQNKFSKLSGKPLNMTVATLRRMGYVDAGDLDADKYDEQNQYEFEYITDNGRPVFNAANWLVEEVSVDERGKRISFMLSHKKKGGK